MNAAISAPRQIELRGLRKQYGNTRALDGLDLVLRAGEVLGIAGPNGAGKSTLMRILAGEELADSGVLVADGKSGAPGSISDLVAVVHQEPQLFPNLTVAANLMVGREPSAFKWPRLKEDDRNLMDALGIVHFADQILGSCSLATQQRTEIARALARDARIFLFDEPNSALTDEESDELFSEMHRLADVGHIVVLVTHRLGDLVGHAIRVAVVRDGQVTAVIEGESLSEEAIAQQLVVGRDFEREAKIRSDAPTMDNGRRSLVARSWTQSQGAFTSVELAVQCGEIVALMGVEGSGARELLRSFGGLYRCTGVIELEGTQGQKAVDRLTAYVAAARQESLYSNLSVGHNLLVRLGQPQIARSVMALRLRRMRRLASDAIRRFSIKAHSVAQPIRSLSGGNQQKVAIAQALMRRPKLLLLEEPTRGVDISSKREIYGLLRQFSRAGNSVVMYCTEVLEVFEAADRVLVVSDGSLSKALDVKIYQEVEALAGDITRLERPRGAAVRSHGSETGPGNFTRETSEWSRL
jgi:ABC-type sugar transport system ATPase subunit